MNERPIILTADEVRGVLDGRQTQLRRVKRPPGEVGQRLWCRETWADLASNRIGDSCAPKLHYRADYGDRLKGFFKWRPSVHMPRWASRLTLEVTNVRVERLQDISEADAIASGHELSPCGACDGGLYRPNDGGPFGPCCPDCMNTGKEIEPVWEFQEYWDAANPKHPWASSPWVWVVEFEVVR